MAGITVRTGSGSLSKRGHNERGGPDKIGSLAVPGLCTGVGAMTFGEAARQMRTAYDDVLGNGWREIVHPAMAPYALGRTSHKGWFNPDAAPPPS